jgi:hypothetical protein
MEERAALIAERKRCGTTIKAFCASKGISYNTFTGWTKKNTGASLMQRAADFVPVVLAGDRTDCTVASCRLRIGSSMEIVVDESISESVLVRILKSIEAVCGPILIA